MTAHLDRIGLLSAEYVAYGQAAAALAHRLDTVARLELPTALDRALEGTFGDDETVYVLRDVHAELALRVDAPDAARNWAEALAVAIADAVADDPGDGVRLARFADEPAYLAGYLADHVRGEAAGHWYFRALERFHDLPTGEVLRELADEVPADLLFAALHRQGRLRELLAAIPATVLSGLIERPPADDLAGLWPLLVAAVRVADLWPLWTSAGLTTLEVARRYRARPVPDWRDPAALTALVLDILRSLPEIGRPAGPPPGSLAGEFGWLDRALLEQGLTEGTPRGRRPSARETGILAAVRAAAERLEPRGAGPAAVILLRAAVFADHPEWTDDPLVESALVKVTEGTTAETETSEGAGLLLLLRGVADLGLPGLFARIGIRDALSPALVAVGARLTDAEPGDPAVAAFAGLPADAGDAGEKWDGIVAAHGPAIERELAGVLRGLRVDAPAGADVTGTLAGAVLAVWARWLGRCADLPEADLLRHFVRRPGRLSWQPRELRVELEARLLDVVLRAAGYDQALDSVSWLGNRRVSFRLVAP